MPCEVDTAVLDWTPGIVDLRIPQGATPLIPFQLVTVDEDTEIELPLPLTGATVVAQARVRPESPVILLTFNTNIVNATEGRITIQPIQSESQLLPPESYYDVRITLGGQTMIYIAGRIISRRTNTR